MNDSEKVGGKKVLKILEQLKHDHTILNIHIMGTDFDGLTVILGVSDGESPRFFIDNPGRSDSVPPLSVGRKCYFEFSDEEKIKYSFKTTVDSIFGKRIKFNFPEFIERSQRRKFFRVPVPSGSTLFYSNKNNPIKFDVFNVSEGGLLISLKSEFFKKDVLYKGNNLKRLALSARHEDFSASIDIETVEIVRVDIQREIGRVSFGFKFIDIERKDHDELRRFIYYCQRRELKKRGGLGD